MRFLVHASAMFAVSCWTTALFAMIAGAVQDHNRPLADLTAFFGLGLSLVIFCVGMVALERRR
jgi:hypothetical protein